MDWGPIVSALLRRKVGAALIALQIAVTPAVLCNALFIIRQRTAQSRVLSGIGDESSVFVITNRWLGRTGDLAAREKADLARLRALPEIIDATASWAHPLGGPVWAEGITLHPAQPRSGTVAMVYLVDVHALNTLDLKLIAGRNFDADEVVDRHGISEHATSLGGVIVTQAVARKLSPDGKVLGRTAVIRPDGTTAPVIGVVLGLAANLWMLQSIALARLPLIYPFLAVTAMLILGQLAVPWPALRAASVPPAIATRKA